MSFENKVVLITGASSGIGAACAEYFVKEGAKVALVGRNAEKFKNVVAKIKQSSITAEPLVILADVSIDAKRIIDETIEKYQRLDILINNAAFGKLATIETITMELYDSIMNTNLRSVVELTQLAVPYLSETKGNVVNISSIASNRAFPGFLPYCMSKAALDQFTKCAALELAPKGIRVNCVNPGIILTDFAENAGFSKEQVDAKVERAKETYPVGRVGESEDVVGAIAYLANEKSSFITGVCFTVDGGITLSINLPSLTTNND